MSTEKKKRTVASRIGSIIVWTTFALVAIVPFLVLHDRGHQPFQTTAPQLGLPFWQQQQPRFRRPPTRVHPPAAEVPNDLPRFQIEIAPKDEQVLRGYFWNGWRGQQHRPEVLATVREGGTTYTNVALHLKGAAGSFRMYDDKPALTLNFNKQAHGQRFGKYSKISLNNSVQDPTYLSEALCRELYNAAGVPTPRAEWATVVINGRDLGLYVMLEGYNKDFLKQHFKNTKGNLYDGGFCQEINQNLAVNSGDHPEDHSDLQRLWSASAQSSPEGRWEHLNEVLDTDRFISLLAMDVIDCNWDGYGMNLNNYRVFHDLDSDRLIFMPHGLDQMFAWPPFRFSVDSSVQPIMKGMVARAILNTAEGNRLYWERLHSLQTNVFVEDNLLRRIHELDQRIRPTLMAYDPNDVQSHDANVAALCDRIVRRLQSVREQLTVARDPVQFEANGTMLVTNWTERFNSQENPARIQAIEAGGRRTVSIRQPGTAPGFQLDQVEEDGRNLLHISAANQGGTASWRTRVMLGQGRYRLEGRARVSPEAVGSRICLRISRGRAALQPAHTTDWIPLNYSFSVDGFQAEVVLVCEFSGARGEVWFDRDTLRLVKE